MPINILMPALSPTMEKGNLARWHKKEGDRVSPGEVIAEIETDKATMDYEAVDEGTLAKIVVPEGTPDVPVNQLIAVLATEGEDVAAAATQAPGLSAAPTTSARVPSPQPSPPPKSDVSDFGQSKVPNSGKREFGWGEGAGRGTTPSQSVTSPQRGEVAARSAAGEGDLARERPRIFASPLARRLAREAGIEISRIDGSGPHGRVVARDIESVRSAKAPLKAELTAAPSTQMPTPSDEKIRALFEPGSYDFVPHDNMRRIIAQRLVQAKQTIPHFYLSLSCTMDRLLAAREDINATARKGQDGKPAWKLSVNDFVIKAMALALMKVPEANVTWTEGGMLKHKHADIGVAVAISGGLITPVVRGADSKGLIAISNEMKDYAARARTRRLKPEEYQGGSTAISNLGMYGIEEFSAVINPPHATILAVGAAEAHPVVRGGKIVVATQMKVTLSTDHRAVDGALGAELLSAFKEFIENPVMMVV